MHVQRLRTKVEGPENPTCGVLTVRGVVSRTSVIHAGDVQSAAMLRAAPMILARLRGHARSLWPDDTGPQLDRRRSCRGATTAGRR